MSQANSGDMSLKNNTEEEEIIANLELLLNYDSLEQADSWDVLTELADLGKALESETEEEDGN